MKESEVARWKHDLRAAARRGKDVELARFFKTGKGEYGEGDVFVGVMVPDNRHISKQRHDLPFDAIARMLESREHEFRLAALLALVEKYKKARRDERAKRAVVDFYLTHTAGINNWDLVDLSCPYILGAYHIEHPEVDLLTPLSERSDMWLRRIAIVSTLTMIREGRFDLTLRFAERYLTAREDLIHKATGWMLREVGKRDEAVLLEFLDAHASAMPRTALRYAIERLNPEERKHYMSRK